ncbi:unnamed protein product [Nippostrongylus brasiliensis]|uniref:Secreted protein n=1 Tax=Nippostrongylus brasiliensis TaxID=27835 RepID=A0A0N4YF98_NIPBR|nr:unnamed protein product [Nippostrongylus brasiliensis]
MRRSGWVEWAWWWWMLGNGLTSLARINRARSDPAIHQMSMHMMPGNGGPVMFPHHMQAGSLPNLQHHGMAPHQQPPPFYHQTVGQRHSTGGVLVGAPRLARESVGADNNLDPSQHMQWHGTRRVAIQRSESGEPLKQFQMSWWQNEQFSVILFLVFAHFGPKNCDILQFASD